MSIPDKSVYCPEMGMIFASKALNLADPDCIEASGELSVDICGLGVQQP